MKKQIIVAIVALLTSVLMSVGWAFPKSGRQQDGEEKLLKFSELSLEMQTPKKEYALLEPIPITLTLSNRKAFPVAGHAVLDFSANVIQLYVSQGGGDPKRIDQLSPARISLMHESKGARIKPGAVRQSTQLLTMDLNQYFPQPGVYQLQAILPDLDGEEEISSNKVTVKIVEPDSQSLAAYQYLVFTGKSSHFFTALMFTDAEGEDIVKALTDNYGDSVYGGYADYLLGEYYFSRKKYDKAFDRLDKVVKREKFIFADKAKEYLAEIKEKRR